MRGGTLRQCIGKGKFHTSQSAEKKIEQIQKQNPSQYMRWYYCGICTSYHLTSKHDSLIDGIRPDTSKQKREYLDRVSNPKPRDAWFCMTRFRSYAFAVNQTIKIFKRNDRFLCTEENEHSLRSNARTNMGDGFHRCRERTS